MADAPSTEEFRKIQLTGRASYIVSLPKKWVSKLGLKPGDQIAIRPLDDSSLSLIPKKLVKREPKKEAQIIISPSDDIQSIVRRILSLYTVGFSLGGLPTLTYPRGTDTGIQITANKNKEDIILKFANYLNKII